MNGSQLNVSQFRDYFAFFRYQNELLLNVSHFLDSFAVPDCSQFPDYFPFFQKLSLTFPRISQIPVCPVRFHLLIRSYAPKIFVLLVYVNRLIFEELMYVHPSEKFLLEQKVGLNPLLSEILPASTNLGQCSASDLILRCHWHHMKRRAFHIEAKC